MKASPSLLESHAQSIYLGQTIQKMTVNSYGFSVLLQQSPRNIFRRDFAGFLQRAQHQSKQKVFPFEDLKSCLSSCINKCF